MEPRAVRLRRWLLVPALVVVGLLVGVAVRVRGVIRRYDAALAAPVFKGSEGCVAEVLARREAPASPEWTTWPRDEVLDGSEPVDSLPAEALADLDRLRPSQRELLQCHLMPYELPISPDFSGALAMVPVDVRLLRSRGQNAEAAQWCVDAARFGLELARGPDVGDASMLLFDLELACPEVLADAPAQQAIVDALEMPPFDGVLDELVATQLQLASDRRDEPDLATRVARWRTFAQQDAKRRKLLREMAHPGPARDQALDGVCEALPQARVQVDLWDGVKESLGVLQRRDAGVTDER